MNPTVYVHDLDPVIWQITDSIALRWYGLAYLMGFIGGYYLLSWLSRRKLYPVPQDRMADFGTYVAFFGVLIGGRLGICALLPDSQSRLVPVSGGSAHGTEGVGRGAWPATGE